MTLRELEHPDSRAAHNARPTEVVPLAENWHLRREATARYFLGHRDPVPEHDGGVAYATRGDNDEQHLWIQEEFRDHPALVYYEGRVPDSVMTARFRVGYVDYGHLVRCCCRPDVGHIICLPTKTEAKAWIHFYRMQTHEEWATWPGFMHKKITDDEMGGKTLEERVIIANKLTAPFVSEGWQRMDDPRTGDIWLRRRI